MKIKRTKAGYYKFEFFGDTIVTKKPPKLTLDTFIKPTYSVSTNFFVDMVSDSIYYSRMRPVKLLYYLGKVKLYLNEEAKKNPSILKTKRVNKVDWAIRELCEIIEKNGDNPNKKNSSYSFTDDEENDMYLSYDLDENILGKVYSEYYIRKQSKNLIKNYELNMKFFASLKTNSFNMCLNKMVDKYKFKELIKLNDADYKSGYYILVLDEYKQIYVGMARNVGYRILQHVRKIKQFDRRIFGKVDNSILSIDSFGALDVTRIFVKYDSMIHDLDFNIEDELINYLPNKYVINRLSGGTLSPYNILFPRNRKLT